MPRTTRSVPAGLSDDTSWRPAASVTSAQASWPKRSTRRFDPAVFSGVALLSLSFSLSLTVLGAPTSLAASTGGAACGDAFGDWAAALGGSTTGLVGCSTGFDGCGWAAGGLGASTGAF